MKPRGKFQMKCVEKLSVLASLRYRDQSFWCTFSRLLVKLIEKLTRKTEKLEE